MVGAFAEDRERPARGPARRRAAGAAESVGPRRQARDAHARRAVDRPAQAPGDGAGPRDAQPRLLLLDEITGGVDQRSIPGLVELVAQARMPAALHLLVIEHNMRVIMEHRRSGWCALHLGEVIADGPPAVGDERPRGSIEAYLGQRVWRLRPSGRPATGGRRPRRSSTAATRCSGARALRVAPGEMVARARPERRRQVDADEHALRAGAGAGREDHVPGPAHRRLPAHEMVGLGHRARARAPPAVPDPHGAPERAAGRHYPSGAPASRADDAVVRWRRCSRILQAPRRGQLAHTLSGGEQQMVAIARGLMAGRSC